MGGKWADLLPSIPEGENYLWHTARGGGMPLFGWRTRYWSFLLKLAKDRPSWTIQAQPGPATGPFHWTNRRLSVAGAVPPADLPRRPAVRLRSQRRAAHARQRRAVARRRGHRREIRGQLLSNPVKKKNLQLLPPRRKPTASPERVAAVPRAYLSLVGNHAEHPGEGLGNRARAAA